jgi:hypothetical protein
MVTCAVEGCLARATTDYRFGSGTQAQKYRVCAPHEEALILSGSDVVPMRGSLRLK